VADEEQTVKTTPIGMINSGWHNLGYKEHGLEVWQRGNSLALYNRTEQKIIVIKKIKDGRVL
jgi:hypothetical protein